MDRPRHDHGITVVLDTNVLLEIWSLHDYSDAVERAIAERGVADVRSAELVFRRSRARDSLLLAVRLDATGARTLSLRTEPLALVRERVPTDAPSLERAFTHAVAHLVKDFVLPDWFDGMPRGGDGGVRKSPADDYLIACASELGVPFITNEGNTPDGLEDKGARRKARQRGVAVFAPHEFLRDALSDDEAAARFLDRLAQHGPRFVASADSPTTAQDLVDFMAEYYRHVLLGDGPSVLTG